MRRMTRFVTSNLLITFHRLSAPRRLRYYMTMSITTEKVAEMLALPEEDRAFLARELIASLDPHCDPDAETQWYEVLDRRSREIEQDQVVCQPVDETLREIRGKLNARRQPS